MGDKIDDIVKKAEQGETVISDKVILKHKTEGHIDADAVTAPTMATLIRLKSQEFLKQQQNPEE